MLPKSSQAIVSMRNIQKRFGSTYALRGVDLTVKKGEVHALLGRNGAGKSTLVSALSGFIPADEGSINVDGIEIHADGQEYAAIIREKVAHVQQTPRLFNLLTVAENLLLENPDVRNRFGFVDQKKSVEKAKELISAWNLDFDLEGLAGALSAEARQLLEIMKALGRGVPIIILDEPTAALTNSEKALLYENVKRLKNQGVSFIYISHHLDEVFEVADTVTILRDGEVVLPSEPVANLDIKTIANLMVGEDVVKSARSDMSKRSEEPVLRVQDLRLSPHAPGSISFSVYPGEIVALAGPVGAGKELLAEIVAGVAKAASGEIIGQGGKAPTTGYVPTDRHESGYVGILSIRENITAGGLEVLSDAMGFIKSKAEKVFTNDLSARTNVLATSNEQTVAQLSGGNQQKVVFARALCRSPQLVVALSPTRGVDVGAKEQLYELLRKLAADGIGILVVSDEHEEIDQIANRVLVVFDNEIVAELNGKYSIEDLVLKMEGVA